MRRQNAGMRKYLDHLEEQHWQKELDEECKRQLELKDKRAKDKVKK